MRKIVSKYIGATFCIGSKIWDGDLNKRLVMSADYLICVEGNSGAFVAAYLAKQPAVKSTRVDETAVYAGTSLKDLKIQSNDFLTLSANQAEIHTKSLTQRNTAHTYHAHPAMGGALNQPCLGAC